MQIDVFQDTVCPWCRIGKRHLQLALEHWEGDPVEVRYRSFFLQPDIPAEGLEFHSMMRAKGGGRVPLEDFFDAPRQMGARVGLTFNFEKIERAPNTLLSHRLIALARDENREALIDDLYAAYFEHGEDVGNLDVLVRIAEQNGLDPVQVREQLKGDAAKDEVQADARWARMHGISGVPFFVINQKYGISGAQPPEELLRILQEVQARESSES